MSNANWGLGDWGQGTTYQQPGAFVQRDLQGGASGLTPMAFQTLGAGLQSAGSALQNPGQSPAAMGMAGLANGAKSASAWDRQQQQHQQQTQAMGQQPEGQGGGEGGDAKSMLGLRGLPDMWRRHQAGQPGGLASGFQGAFKIDGGQ